MRFFTALALLPVLLLSSCGCLDFSQGQMTVQTDCSKAGSFTPSTFTFQKLPESAAKGLLGYFGISASQSQLNTVTQLLDCPTSSGLSCDARGAGIDHTAAVKNLVTPGAALCGSKLIAVGKVVNDAGDPMGFYVCNAHDSTVGDQLWIMQCQKFSVESSNQVGTCHGLATYNAQIKAGL